jgi:hypothetical protein
VNEVCDFNGCHIAPEKSEFSEIFMSVAATPLPITTCTTREELTGLPELTTIANSLPDSASKTISDIIC